MDDSELISTFIKSTEDKSGHVLSVCQIEWVGPHTPQNRVCHGIISGRGVHPGRLERLLGRWFRHIEGASGHRSLLARVLRIGFSGSGSSSQSMPQTGVPVFSAADSMAAMAASWDKNGSCCPPKLPSAPRVGEKYQLWAFKATGRQ